MLAKGTHGPRSRRSAIARAALLILAACAAPGCGASAAPEDSRPALAVRRGRLAQTLLLTGELDAAVAAELSIPRVPINHVAIRWIADDGTRVKKGDRVIELDNSQFTADLKEKKLAQLQAAIDLAEQRYEGRSQIADKSFELERRRTELDKAKAEAQVGAGVVPRRELLEKQLALAKAQAELAKAEEALRTQRAAADLDVRVKQLALAKAEREISAADKAIASLAIAAPRDGIFLVGDHPWEGRKLQIGDEVWVGFRIGRIPDLSSMEVKANLSDVDDGRVSVGQAAVSTLDAYPDLPIPGRVEAIAPVAREASPESLRRSFEVRVSLEKIDLARMRPGMSVKVEVTGAALEGALLAPRQGLDLGCSPPRARLRAGGEVEVKLGPCSAADCVVEEGLQEGAPLR